MLSQKKQVFLYFLIILPLIAMVGGLFVGRYSLSPVLVLKALFCWGGAQDSLALERALVLGQRLPRILLAALVGATLGIGGASFQGLFCNPLVSPDIVGVTAGTAFGAVLGILLFGGKFFTPLLALPFGLLAVAVACWLARVTPGDRRLTLVLSGIVMAAVFNALIALVKYMADPQEVLPVITHWLLGSLASASYEDLKLVFLPVSLGIGLLLLLRWRINLLSLGEEEARSLGIDPHKVRWMVIGGVTLSTAAVISVTGVVGWVGLVIPHIGRMLVGPDHTKLLPASLSLGAAYVVLIDTLCRTLTAAEIPLGVLTALVGAPFFIWILKKTGGRWG
ncbi:FecCD family ABC transporter permease [Desulfothermobacter acidiphilus]|uniref:FecCD family ABC transporter permease n=1 Tax=Desulfothermobacter acidiphilus TaxID=1938353 RepID=UPI003F88A738